MAANLWKAATSNAFNTTLNGSVSAGDTSITLTSASGLQAPGVVVIDRINTSGVATPTSREYISFTGISTNTLTGCTRGLGGSSGQGHASGSIVEEAMSISHWNDMITALLNVLTSAGALDTTKVVDLSTAQSLTNKTLGSGSKLLVGSDATGDIHYNGGSGALTRLGVGSDGSVLTLASGIPSWVVSTASTDGWTTSADTWTYASATTFTISGVDRTTTYTKGTRLRLKQGGSYKYFFVVSSAFSTNTTVTLTGGTDYTLANAAITDNYYSYMANPQGYPGTFNYTPTYAGSASMTFGTVTTNIAQFSAVGNMISLVVYARGTTGGTPSTSISFTLPVTSSTTQLRGGTYVRATADQGGFYEAADANTINCFKYDAGNFSIGASEDLSFNGVYPF